MERQKSLINNVIFNFVKTLSSLVFPIITFAYCSRVLGADGIGKANFAKSVISYFTMIAMLGMNYYGTREAAKLRDNREKLSHFAQEMLVINVCSTILAYIAFAVSLFLVKKLQDYTLLLLVNSISIVLMGMGMEWLYQALEEYRYIALRAMMFQVIALVVMFITVRNADNVVSYAFVTILASSGSYVLNFINSRKYIDFQKHGKWHFRKHLKPICWLFAMAVSIELYTVLDSTMLEFMKDDVAVGIYTAAVKINKIVNSLITSLGVVLIPRLSYYVGIGEKTKMKARVTKAYQYVFLFSIPACLALFVLSDEIVLLFSGSGFEAAGFTMRLLTPIVLVIPFSVVTNQQTFVPMGKEKLIIISTCTGAITNIICNSILIPRYAENGAAAATVIAESCVAAVCLWNIKRYISVKEIFAHYYQYWLAALPIFAVGFICKLYISNVYILVILTAGISAALYFGILYLFRNETLLETKDIVMGKLRRR